MPLAPPLGGRLPCLPRSLRLSCACCGYRRGGVTAYTQSGCAAPSDTSSCLRHEAQAMARRVAGGSERKAACGDRGESSWWISGLCLGWFTMFLLRRLWYQGWRSLEQASRLSPQTLTPSQEMPACPGPLASPHPPPPFPRQAAQARMWMRTVNRHSLNIYPHFLWVVSPTPKAGCMQVNSNE